jgi:hypothetical protein
MNQSDFSPFGREICSWNPVYNFWLAVAVLPVLNVAFMVWFAFR